MDFVRIFSSRLKSLTIRGRKAFAFGIITIALLLFWQNFMGEAKQIAVVSQFDKSDEKWSTFNGSDISYKETDGNFDGHIESSIERNFAPLDLVLAIDNTASMRNTINAVKDKATELIESLKEKNPSLRIGILNITDLDYEKEIKYSDLTNNIEMQLSFLDTLGLTNGGNGDPSEDVYASLSKSLEFDWRDKEDDEEVLKIIVVITDNPPKKREISVEEIAKNIKSLDNSFLLPIVTSNRPSAINELFGFAEQINSVNRLKRRKVTLNNITEVLLQEINLSWRTNDPWYWKAPRKYRTDWRPAYNQYITYSIKAEDAGYPFDHKEDIKIVGKKGQTLTYDLEGTPRTNWTNYKVPLNEMGGWILRDSARAPTLEEFMNILGYVKDFQIRGDYYEGTSTCYLDNVSVIGFLENDNTVPTDIKFVRAKTGYSLGEGLEWVSTGEKVRIQAEYPEIIGGPVSIPLSYSTNNKIQVPLFRTIHNPKVFLSDPILVSDGSESTLTSNEIFLPPAEGVIAGVYGGVPQAEIKRYPFTARLFKSNGFITDEVSEIDVESPILPRFFVNEYGDISVDIASEKLRKTRDVILRIHQKSEDPEDEPSELYKQSIHPFVINSNPNSNSRGRWYTLNLNALVAGMLEDRTGLFDLQDVFLRLTLVGDSEIDYFSPLLDRYKQLDNIRVKAESLSKELTGLPLRNYLHKNEEYKIPGRAWFKFTKKADVLAFATLKNHYPNDDYGSLDETFELYALEKDTIRLIKEINFNVRPNDSDIEHIDLGVVNWDIEHVRNFNGLQLVLKRDAKRLIEDGVQGSSTYQMKFRYDPSLAGKIAGLLIEDFLEEGFGPPQDFHFYNNYHNAAEEFLETVPTNKTEQAALNKAREWKTKIEDFLFCLERLNEAFEDDSLYELYDLLSKESDNTIFHFGHPREGSIVYDRTTGRDDFEVDEDYDLGKTSSEIFLRGLASFGTTGRAAGDLPDAAKEVLEREVERRVLAQNAYRASQWKIPKYYSRKLFNVNPDDAQAFIEYLSSRNVSVFGDEVVLKSDDETSSKKPDEVDPDNDYAYKANQFIDDARDVYSKVVAIKLDADKRLKEHKKKGRDAIFISGFHLTTQDGNPNLKPQGQQLMDGAIIEIRNGDIFVHEIYGFESFDSKIFSDDLAKQLEGGFKSKMQEFGLRIKSPTTRTLNYIRSKGLSQLSKEVMVGKKITTVIDFPKDAIFFIPGKHNRIMIKPANANISSEYERSFEEVRSEATAQEIRDFTINMLETAGIGSNSWDRVDHNIIQYWNHYQILVRKGFATQMDRVSVEQKFLLGERFDPINMEWVDIFDRDDGLRGSNPLTPWIHYYPYIKRLNITKPRKGHEEKTRIEFFNEGKRRTLNENGNLSIYKPSHIYTPHNASIAEMERIYIANEILSGNIKKGEEEKALLEFQKQIEDGKVYDWRDLKFVDRIYPKQWQEPQIERFNELIKKSPEEARQIRLTQVKATASDIGASAIQALNAGLLEASRVANQRLLVQVRRMPGSNHTFITAQRREKRGDQFFEVHHVDSPIQQKLNLILWFERDQGLFAEPGIPVWLLEAEADGDKMDWYGNK